MPIALDGMIWAIGGLAALIVGALGAAWLSLRKSADPALRRLRSATTRAGGVGEPALRLQAGQVLDLESAGDEATSRLRQQLVWAGIRSARAPQVFLASKIVLVLLGLGLFAIANAARAEPLQMGLPIAAWIAGVGFFLPNLWLRSRVASRQAQIDRSLPDALDLLVTCVEAGLALDGALQRVSDEIALAHKLLSRELRLVFLEIKAGIPRVAAFRRLADRTGSPELRSLSATLAQTEMFGTSVGAALRVQAEGIRIRRMQRAEEKAAYVSVKMSLPLVLFILPALFAIVLGPAIVNIVDKLFPAMGGQ